MMVYLSRYVLLVDDNRRQAEDIITLWIWSGFADYLS